jgi:hypothetical protein
MKGPSFLVRHVPMGGAPMYVDAVPAIPLKNVPALGTYVGRAVGDPLKGLIEAQTCPGLPPGSVAEFWTRDFWPWLSPTRPQHRRLDHRICSLWEPMVYYPANLFSGASNPNVEAQL